MNLATLSFVKNVIVLCVLFLTACNLQGDRVKPPHDSLEFQVDFHNEPVYRQGEHSKIAIDFKVVDPDRLLKEGVVFLSLVEQVKGVWPPAAQLILQSADIPQDIFATILAGDDLRRGFSLEANFVLKEDAKPGTYFIVLQAFDGTNTNPNRVHLNDRIGLSWSRFEVVKR